MWTKSQSPNSGNQANYKMITDHGPRQTWKIKVDFITASKGRTLKPPALPSSARGLPGRLPRGVVTGRVKWPLLFSRKKTLRKRIIVKSQ